MQSAIAVVGTYRQCHLVLSCALQLVHGQVTDVFARHPEPARAHLSFSLVYEEDSSVRTLDLTCPTQRDFEYWYFGIKVCGCHGPLYPTALLF
jgi:hypothetical protein